LRRDDFLAESLAGSEVAILANEKRTSKSADQSHGGFGKRAEFLRN
jgi:hypothetical protein